MRSYNKHLSITSFFISLFYSTSIFAYSLLFVIFSLVFSYFSNCMTSSSFNFLLPLAFSAVAGFRLQPTSILRGSRRRREPPLRPFGQTSLGGSCPNSPRADRCMLETPRTSLKAHLRTAGYSDVLIVCFGKMLFADFVCWFNW